MEIPGNEVEKAEKKLMDAKLAVKGEVFGTWTEHILIARWFARFSLDQLIATSEAVDDDEKCVAYLLVKKMTRTKILFYWLSSSQSICKLCFDTEFWECITDSSFSPDSTTLVYRLADFSEVCLQFDVHRVDFEVGLCRFGSLLAMQDGKWQCCGLRVTFKMSSGIRRESTATDSSQVKWIVPVCRMYFNFMFLHCKSVKIWRNASSTLRSATTRDRKWQLHLLLFVYTFVSVLSVITKYDLPPFNSPDVNSQFLCGRSSQQEEVSARRYFQGYKVGRSMNYNLHY
ncbi:hypothetical protein DAPPUDRAFT_112104 [Daphnia pulex]|uniref:Uncharacterized protein n=1 Tax=Daphnia pulex TaxID=6669 RepID=E9HAZ4_DAPPU|nr:hypothetical protein DAPPUDRAFT_112104 [Daphnia pulex]|eukprot:EFX71133.1 hypothetical protein DAPPUDRAFT_112104 [Daphnia pulex]